VPDQAFNIEQALISIGSGGWFGKGYLNGTQSQLGFLRVQHTDFIFSVIVGRNGAHFRRAGVLGLMGFYSYAHFAGGQYGQRSSWSLHLRWNCQFPLVPDCR
jgi:cell division protein FtsW (lipid II flippase)